MTETQALFSITAIAAATFLTRVIPFLLFPDNRPVPKYVRYLGNALPFSVIGMLIVYCLKSVNASSFPFAIPEAAAIAFIVFAHKWKHNLLLSILGGTALYMILIQTVFST